MDGNRLKATWTGTLVMARFSRGFQELMKYQLRTTHAFSAMCRHWPQTPRIGLVAYRKLLEALCCMAVLCNASLRHGYRLGAIPYFKPEIVVVF